MKEIPRIDRNGTRTSEELRRRYKLNDIDLTKDEVEIIKTLIVVDEALSTTSTNSVQNKVVTQALNSKVNKETGKGLSTNDFTNTYKANLESATTNNHTHSNKTVLDKVTQTHLDNSHTHSNKTVLDKITDDDITTWNNLALYENGGTTDANTTTEPLILTKVNAPTTDFWYIETLFYSSISNTSNRKQIAYSYKFDAPIYTRYFISGVWSEWKSILKESDKSYNLSSYKASGLTILRSSCIKKNDRVVINFTGTISVAANTTTILFTLPEELRPKQIKDFVVFGQNSNDDGYIGYGQISTEGSLQVRFNTAISSYIRFSVVYDLE